MLPRSKLLVLHIGRYGAALWRNAAGEYVEINRSEFDHAVRGPFVDNIPMLIEALAEFANSCRGEFDKSHVEVLLDPCLAPGVIVNLGDRLLPKRIRQSFLSARFSAVIGSAASSWRIRSHPTWITGPALGFGVHNVVSDKIEEAMRGCKARSISIKPTFVWCWNQRDSSTFTGLFVSDSGQGVSTAYCLNGRPVTFDTLERSAQLLDWPLEAHRHLLLHGITESTQDIRMVGIPGLSLADTSLDTSAKATVAARGVMP